MDWPAGVIWVIDRLTDAGYEAYAVGGCVRDWLLKRAPVDWDVATCARPDQVRAALDGARVIETGIKHGTLTAIYGGQAVEVTTFRADGAYTDHRRPDEVRFVSSLRADLSRRDFTINAMAMKPGGAPIDYFGGRADLAARAVRAVGRPETRFAEDALRILRALRFAAQLDFTVEPATARALHDMRSELKHVSAERIYSELKRLLVGPGTARVLLGFPEVLAEAAPFGFYDARLVGRLPEDAVLRLAVMMRGGDVRLGLRKLRADNAATGRAELLAALSKRPTPGDARGALTLLRAAGGTEAARDALAIWRAEGRDVDEAQELVEALIRQNACYRLSDLKVNGRDLIALGVPRGPALGSTLEALLDRVMAGETPNERKALLEAARGMKLGMG
ncbi:MAG: CCA tRNA nucleotidyltransferase [Eubacteriales bacterium]|nr:CCA tRNA nucleotidyltransferase [Christensenellaceae bacterium]MEA5066107.1 CCA tRNA nucleotidyltransferase [Eubacteriales bacterium]